MRTSDLINQLAVDAHPVRRLPAPAVRALLWFAIAILSGAVVVVLMVPRPDLPAKLVDLRYLIEQAAAFATAVAAALAAFSLIVPGADRRVMALPLVPLTVWLGSMGQGCVSDWLRSGPNGLSLEPDWICFPSIVAVGAVPAAAMAIMLRRGAPLYPHAAVALGGLAAAAIGNFGLRLFHPQDASIMVLVWQFGVVALLSATAGLAGGRILNWRSIRLRAAKAEAFRTADIQQRGQAGAAHIRVDDQDLCTCLRKADGGIRRCRCLAFGGKARCHKQRLRCMPCGRKKDRRAKLPISFGKRRPRVCVN